VSHRSPDCLSKGAFSSRRGSNSREKQDGQFVQKPFGE